MTALSHVLRWAPTNQVLVSMGSRSSTNSWRTRGSFAIWAKARRIRASATAAAGTAVVGPLVRVVETRSIHGR